MVNFTKLLLLVPFNRLHVGLGKENFQVQCRDLKITYRFKYSKLCTPFQNISIVKPFTTTIETIKTILPKLLITEVAIGATTWGYQLLRGILLNILLYT